MTATGIGASVRRKEDQRFITGKGRYVDDYNRPGQAHAYFLRSPHAHATIRGIDTAAASEMPGVVGILTGEDLDQGIDRLVAAVGRLVQGGVPLDELCDRVLGALPAHPDDDVALLALRAHPEDVPRPREAGPTAVPALPDPG